MSDPNAGGPENPVRRDSAPGSGAPDPTSRAWGRNRSLLIASAVGLVAMGLIVVLAIGARNVGDPAASGRKRQAAIIGQVAPPLVGPDLSGKVVGLDSFRGDWVLVNFFASWCPPCIQEHPELIRLSKDDGGPLQIISVGFQDSTENVRSFFEDNGGSWPVLTGDTGRVGIEYGVVKLPESFLVSPFGRVVAKFEGGVTAEMVRSYIDGAGTGAADEGDGSTPAGERTTPPGGDGS